MDYVFFCTGAFLIGYILGRISAKPKADDTPTVSMFFFDFDQVGDIVYAYNAQTGLFLCQGKTIEEVGDRIKELIPGHTYYVARKKPNNESV